MEKELLFEYLEKYQNLYVDWSNSTLIFKNSENEASIEFTDKYTMQLFIQNYSKFLKDLTLYTSVGNDNNETSWEETDINCI